jgi:DNA-binding transcriptional MerR regulator
MSPWRCSSVWDRLIPVDASNVELELGCKVNTPIPHLDLAPGWRVYRGRVRISELADSAGVPTSTVRYYERAGLLAPPARTASGYRDYGDDAAARLLFISRARRMGLSCEQVTSLLPVWAGTNCGAAQERVTRLIEQKQTEIAERIAELEQFSAQLEDVRARLETESPRQACRADLTCCVPESTGGPVALELTPRR